MILQILIKIQEEEKKLTDININLLDEFDFRSIYQSEADEAVSIEQICFPPNEACSPCIWR